MGYREDRERSRELHRKVEETLATSDIPEKLRVDLRRRSASEQAAWLELDDTMRKIRVKQSWTASRIFDLVALIPALVWVLVASPEAGFWEAIWGSLLVGCGISALSEAFRRVFLWWILRKDGLWPIPEEK